MTVRIIRYGFISVCLMLGVVNSAAARVNIDLNFSTGPELVVVPGYPVYYAPQVDRNFFYYDGLYWLYEDDEWYSSDWYNGPWDYVDPEDVPLFVLRVPVRYYRRPPVYFRGWIVDAPPRWGNHWGNRWEYNHRGWDHWDHRHVPQRAPLPNYHRDSPANNHFDRDRDRDRQYDNRDRGNDNRRHNDGRPQSDYNNGNQDRHRGNDGERGSQPREATPSPRDPRGGDHNNFNQRIPYQPRPPATQFQRAPQTQPQEVVAPAQQPQSQPQQQQQQQRRGPENNRNPQNDGRGFDNR